MWKRDQQCLISKFDPVCDVSVVFYDISRDPRVSRIVSQSFGEPGLIFKDKLIYKLPGHPGFGPHQDITWYRGFPEEILAIVIAIDEASAESGAIEVAPQAHNLPNPVPFGEIRDLYSHEIPNHCLWKPVYMKPGDLLVLSSKLPHRSPPNRSKYSRRAVFYSFSPERYGDLYLDYYKTREKILRLGMGDTLGNFNMPSQFRQSAKYLPSIQRAR